MAGAAGLLDLKEEHIAVAVRKPAADFLRVTAGLALEPKRFSRAAPIVHEAGFEGLLEGFAIHPREHQDATARHVAAGSLLNDCGNETFGGEFEIEFHCCRIADCRIIGKRRVKESEISEPPAPASPAPQGTLYRYFSRPPITVSLRLADIASQIPEAVRLPAFDAEHRIELLCEDVFVGPAPKLLLSRLAEIASEHVRLDGVPDSAIRLPAAELALGYHFINGRELLEEPVQPENESAGPQGSSHPLEDFAPKAEASEESPMERKEDVAPPKSEAPTEAGSPSAVVVPLVADPMTPPIAAPLGPPDADPAATNLSTQEADAGVTLSPSREVPLQQEDSTPAVPESPVGDPAPPAVSETWRPISIFPIFRRKGIDQPPIAPPRSPVEFPKPRAPFVPSEFSSSPAPSEPKVVEVPVEEPAPAAQEAILVETEHLPKSEFSRTAEIANQDALQAVFMTEEFLSVDRVVELCGGLPGIKSCVLAHGSAVLASHNVPESIDLISLSAHALEMLAAMRQSAARMGIGAVPAVTIHSEKGPITFFHQDDLCLLVLHKNRGFIPGVREKLQQVVEHLSQANLALPVGTRPALASREATF
jgi:predicted regulator of Ras-like GTPase activity (Roadblock/LC7/MglB family)